MKKNLVQNLDLLRGNLNCVGLQAKSTTLQLMKRPHLILFQSLFLILLSGLLPFAATAQEADTTVIFRWEIHEEINPAAWRKTQKAFEQAEAADADLMILELNTYGGLLHVADSIRSRFLRSELPIVTWVNNNAASAGALISIATDAIYMSEGANIGAATVVDQSGKPVPDKYQSYMRSIMRSTATAKGRDPDVAEAMVDPDVYVPGISDTGKVLTLTTAEAIEIGFAAGEAESFPELLEKLDVEKPFVVVNLEEKWYDKVIGFLTSPTVSGFLILIMLGGIYFELQTPGIGFPIAAAAIAAVLYFAPLYLEDLAQSWEILLFIVGIALLAVELFVIPGFGIAGISGIVLMLIALVLSLVQNFYFDFTFAGTDNLLRAVLTVLISFVVAVGLLLLFGRNLIQSRGFQSLVLQTRLESKNAYTNIISQKESLVGKTGVAVTDLRPGGKVEIEDEQYDVVSEGGFISRGTRVKVLQDYRTRIVVREVA